MFLGCDGADPIALERMMEATRASGVLGTAWECTFTGEREEGAPVGKGPGDCSRTRERTGWQPKFTSFDDFMTNGKVRRFGGPGVSPRPDGPPQVVSPTGYRAKAGKDSYNSMILWYVQRVQRACSSRGGLTPRQGPTAGPWSGDGREGEEEGRGRRPAAGNVRERRRVQGP